MVTVNVRVTVMVSKVISPVKFRASLVLGLEVYLGLG